MPREVEYMNLLVIEDDRKLNTVKACTDGEEGAYYLQQNAYDLALVDWMLPGESGPDILRESRRKGIMTPVVMLTALTAVENKVTCLDAGADDYLGKPFDSCWPVSGPTCGGRPPSRSWWCCGTGIWCTTPRRCCWPVAGRRSRSPKSWAL